MDIVLLLIVTSLIHGTQSGLTGSCQVPVVCSGGRRLCFHCVLSGDGVEATALNKCQLIQYNSAHEHFVKGFRVLESSAEVSPDLVEDTRRRSCSTSARLKSLGKGKLTFVVEFWHGNKFLGQSALLSYTRGSKRKRRSLSAGLDVGKPQAALYRQPGMSDRSPDRAVPDTLARSSSDILYHKQQQQSDVSGQSADGQKGLLRRPRRRNYMGGTIGLERGNDEIVDTKEEKRVKKAEYEKLRTTVIADRSEQTDSGGNFKSNRGHTDLNIPSFSSTNKSMKSTNPIQNSSFVDNLYVKLLNDVDSNLSSNTSNQRQMKPTANNTKSRIASNLSRKTNTEEKHTSLDEFLALHDNSKIPSSLVNGNPTSHLLDQTRRKRSLENEKNTHVKSVHGLNYRNNPKVGFIDTNVKSEMYSSSENPMLSSDILSQTRRKRSTENEEKSVKNSPDRKSIKDHQLDLDLDELLGSHGDSKVSSSVHSGKQGPDNFAMPRSSQARKAYSFINQKGIGDKQNNEEDRSQVWLEKELQRIVKEKENMKNENTKRILKMNPRKYRFQEPTPRRIPMLPEEKPIRVILPSKLYRNYKHRHSGGYETDHGDMSYDRHDRPHDKHAEMMHKLARMESDLSELRSVMRATNTYRGGDPDADYLYHPARRDYLTRRKRQRQNRVRVQAEDPPVNADDERSLMIKRLQLRRLVDDAEDDVNGNQTKYQIGKSFDNIDPFMLKELVNEGGDDSGEDEEGVDEDVDDLSRYREGGSGDEHGLYGDKTSTLGDDSLQNDEEEAEQDEEDDEQNEEEATQNEEEDGQNEEDDGQNEKEAGQNKEKDELNEEESAKNEEESAKNEEEAGQNENEAMLDKEEANLRRFIEQFKHRPRRDIGVKQTNSAPEVNSLKLLNGYIDTGESKQWADNQGRYHGKQKLIPIKEQRVAYVGNTELVSGEIPSDPNKNSYDRKSHIIRHERENEHSNNDLKLKETKQRKDTLNEENLSYFSGPPDSSDKLFTDVLKYDSLLEGFLEEIQNRNNKIMQGIKEIDQVKSDLTNISKKINDMEGGKNNEKGENKESVQVNSLKFGKVKDQVSESRNQQTSSETKPSKITIALSRAKKNKSRLSKMRHITRSREGKIIGRPGYALGSEGRKIRITRDADEEAEGEKRKPDPVTKEEIHLKEDLVDLIHRFPTSKHDARLTKKIHQEDYERGHQPDVEEMVLKIQQDEDEDFKNGDIINDVWLPQIRRRRYVASHQPKWLRFTKPFLGRQKNNASVTESPTGEVLSRKVKRQISENPVDYMYDGDEDVEQYEMEPEDEDDDEEEKDDSEREDSRPVPNRVVVRQNGRRLPEVEDEHVAFVPTAWKFFRRRP